jgi:hypothetical protein
MFIQLVFSLIAIGLLFLLNRKIGGFVPARFSDEAQAFKTIKTDFPDTKDLKLGQLLYLDQEIAFFEYSQSDKNLADVFGFSQAMGDIFVTRQLPTKMLLNCATKIIAKNNTYSLKLEPHNLTLPSITIKFSDTDPIYYWLLEQNLSLPIFDKKNMEIADATT